MALSISEEQFQRVVIDTWSIQLGGDLQVCKTQDARFLKQPHLAACVHIVGDWHGSVAVECLYLSAEILAGSIFAQAQGGSSVSSDLVHDSMRELANMIGGNVKSLLGAKCILTTPKTTTIPHGAFGVPDGERVLGCFFVSGNESYFVSICESGAELDDIKKLLGG